MRYYICTGIEHFKEVVQEGALLSNYEKLRRVDQAEADSKLEALTKREGAVFKDLVLLTDNKSRYGREGNDLRLEFDLDIKPVSSRGPGYIREREVKLTDLVSIKYTEKVEEELVEILQDTPYASVPKSPFRPIKRRYKRERIPRPRDKNKEHKGH